MEQKLKTNKGLVAYALAQLGRPYWFGTFGQTATPALLAAKRKQYPRYYTATDFPAQYGQRVHDCIGIVKGYMWSEGNEGKPVYQSNGFPDCSADRLLACATDKGPIATFPKTLGATVHMKGHVGVYVGDGWVVEARGHAYGVVRTRLDKRPWKNWALIPNLQYL